MSLEVYLATSRINRTIKDISDTKEVVTPGESIRTDEDFMRGHGTFIEGDILYSSVAGVVDRINKLISVIPPRPKYLGQVGDVVIGRVISVGQKRWNIDIRARLDSILMLAAVHLPGGELRRRSEQDELMMRDFLCEGDLISAEVQTVYESGTVALHTRNLNYGKLSQGVLIKVDSSLIRRTKIRTHRLPCGATVVLGNNGNIWISSTTSKTNRALDYGGFVTDLHTVPLSEREVIARLRNCILGLVKHQVELYDTSITFAYDNSLIYENKELLRPEVMDKLMKATIHQIDTTYISYDDRIRAAYKDDLIVLKNLNLLPT